MSANESSENIGPIAKTLKVPEGFEVATFSSGCFWGVERVFRLHLGDTPIPEGSTIKKIGGLYDARVGFAGQNAVDNPYIKGTDIGKTGLLEAIQVVYDPSVITYDQVVDFFFKTHDPTTLNQQGPDNFGIQYGSAIWTHNDEQAKIAEQVKERLQKEWFDPIDRKITTFIKPIVAFWEADVPSQKYLEKNPTGYQCPTHFLRTAPPTGPEYYKKRDEK